jgi:spermidine/putrescine transport system substrate-binding protein
MDYVYRPEVAADLVEGIAYITPVPAAKEQLQAKAAKASGEDRQALEDLVQSPLIFPSPDDLKNVKRYRALTVEEEQVWDGIFQPLVQS